MWVYKITNIVNNKCYIGITTDLKKRWKSHKRAVNYFNFKHPLYYAMRKYGIKNFKFEVVEDGIIDKHDLGEKERYYIKKYQSHVSEHGYNVSWGGEANQFDGNPRAKLTIEDVIEIRTEYGKGIKSVKECWKEYSDRISYSAFEKIWEGRTWKGVMPEVYNKENKKKQQKFKSNNGAKNGNAIYSEKEVLEARKYYQSHTLAETFKKFGKKSRSKDSFRSVIDVSYSYLPIYSKKNRQWILNGNVINIEEFNPVSTIPESGK